MFVSVILPTFNRAHLICEAIDSILNQTYQKFQIIVVDDGSTDSTAEVLKSYNDRITYIKQENKGPGNARNLGLAVSDGDYIAFLDSDDIWFKNKLELQVAVMEKLPEIGFLCSDFCILKNSEENIHYGLKTWHNKVRPWDDIFERTIKYSSLDIPTIVHTRDFDIYQGNLYYPLLIEPYVLPSSSIVRRVCIDDDIKFAEGVFLYEDWEFFARLSRKYDSAFLTLETVYNRGHSDEIRLTHCGIGEHAESRLGLIERVWKQDPSFSKEFEKDIARVEGNQLSILAKENLLNSRPKAAREFIFQLNKLRLPGEKYKAMVYLVFSFVPGLAVLLRFIRIIRRIIHMRK